MAKARTLAALAGLAGLAYAMRNKDKGESTTDTGDETSRLLARKPAEDGPRRQITDYMKKAPEAEDANYGNEGRRTSMGVAPAPKTITKAAPIAKKPSTLDARNLESGMSRGTRPSAAKNPDYSNEGRNSIAPAKSLSTASSSEEGMKNYKPRRTTPSAGGGRGFVNPPSVKATDPRSSEAGMSRGTRTSVPPFKGGQAGYDEAGNFIGGQRGFDEAGNPMKKGGMTASRRADGIASRGKTRGKMC
jgi:hypothetical protein